MHKATNPINIPTPTLFLFLLLSSSITPPFFLITLTPFYIIVHHIPEFPGWTIWVPYHWRSTSTWSQSHSYITHTHTHIYIFPISFLLSPYNSLTFYPPLLNIRLCDHTVSTVFHKFDTYINKLIDIWWDIKTKSVDVSIV